MIAKQKIYFCSSDVLYDENWRLIYSSNMVLMPHNSCSESHVNNSVYFSHTSLNEGQSRECLCRTDNYSPILYTANKFLLDDTTTCFWPEAPWRVFVLFMLCCNIKIHLHIVNTDRRNASHRLGVGCSPVRGDAKFSWTVYCSKIQLTQVDFIHPECDTIIQELGVIPIYKYYQEKKKWVDKSLTTHSATDFLRH